MGCVGAQACRDSGSNRDQYLQAGSDFYTAFEVSEIGNAGAGSHQYSKAQIGHPPSELVHWFVPQVDLGDMLMALQSIPQSAIDDVNAWTDMIDNGYR